MSPHYIPTTVTPVCNGTLGKYLKMNPIHKTASLRCLRGNFISQKGDPMIPPSTLQICTLTMFV